LPYSFGETLSGFAVVDADNKRYLLVNGLHMVQRSRDGESKMRACMEQYHLIACCNTYPLDFMLTGFKPIELAFEKGVNFVDIIQELVGEDVVRQVAETYGLTVTEYLRFKLTGELPEGKTRPVHPSS